MELKTFLKIISKKFKFIIFVDLLVILIFLIFYFFLPNLYTAEGTLYAYPVNNANQASEVSNELNYSRNIIALSNSPEFKRLLQDSNMTSYSFTPLVGVVGSLKLKEISPNLLSLSVVGESEFEVNKNYKKYLNLLEDYSIRLKKGNSNFELNSISEDPIITRNYKNIYVFLVLGLFSGIFVSIFYLYLKRND